MKNNDKRHRVTITVSDSELDALDDYLVCWMLCKKHNAQTWTPEKGQKSEQEIFRMQDECEACHRQKKIFFRKAWAVTCRLFDARYKAH